MKRRILNLQETNTDNTVWWAPSVKNMSRFWQIEEIQAGFFYLFPVLGLDQVLLKNIWHNFILLY
jgi:hypothetical protein